MLKHNEFKQHISALFEEVNKEYYFECQYINSFEDIHKVNITNDLS